MKYEKTVLYIGSDSEFAQSVRDFYSTHDSSIKFIDSKYENGVIVGALTKKPSHVVVIDFTKIEFCNSLLEEVKYIKQLDILKGVLFVAIFKDKEERNNYGQIYSLGFSLGFIKGGDLEVFLCDIYYISFDKSMRFPTFAKGKDLNTMVMSSVCSSVTSLSEERIFLDTDLDVNDESLQFNLPMFAGLECKNFKIKSRNCAGTSFPMTNSYSLEYPYQGPWDDDSSLMIKKEVVSDWINSKTNGLSTKKKNVFVIAKQISLVNDLFREEIHLRYHIGFCISLSEDVLLDISVKKPALIFFEFNENNENSLEELLQLIAEVKSIWEYHPFVVVTNNKSTSAAFQKVLNYSFIVCTREKLEVQIIKVLLESFDRKRLETGNVNQYFFSTTDELRFLDVQFPVYVTSLTEHSITFYCQSSVPIFSVLHFHLPFSFYATIVDPTERLVPREGYSHHEAFIHGLSEEELMQLRQFINQVIYDPKISFASAKDSRPEEKVSFSTREDVIPLISSPIVGHPNKTTEFKEITGAIKTRAKRIKG